MLEQMKWVVVVGSFGLAIGASSCAKKNSNTQGATGSAKVTQTECQTKPGYQWDGASCVVSTTANNQAMCLNVGKLWQNNACVEKTPANTAAVTQQAVPVATQTPTPVVAVVDPCTSATSIAGSLSCLGSEYSKLSTSMSAITSTSSLAQNLRSDFNVITKNYNQILGRNLTDKSNYLTRTAACTDIASIRFQRMQMSSRVGSSTADVTMTNLKNGLPSFINSVGYIRTALKCSF